MNLARSLLLTLSAGTVFTLGACGGSDPLSDDGGSDEAIVIGSQDYYSSEIIAEIYAQALEADGHEVDRQLRIGQREAYIPEIESGKIDLFPEYTGPLLQFWKPDTDARLADDVYSALQDAMPDGLRALAPSEATDQDSYVVTSEFAKKWDLKTIEDLANVKGPLTLGANSEAESRPNGPRGLKSVYGIEAKFTPIEDGGGPLTVKALQDGDIQLAIIYTADPSIRTNDLVSLEDTKGLFLASQVVPIASEAVSDDAAKTIEKVGAALSADDLLELNQRSVEEELPAKTIAADWLDEQDLD